MNKRYQNPGLLKVRVCVIWILNLSLDLSVYNFEIEMHKGPEMRIKVLCFLLCSVDVYCRNN